jgi:putative nucleotidyltransferase with HDIG domain
MESSTIMEDANVHEVPVSVLREEVQRTLARLSRTGALPTIAPAATAALALARDPDADLGALCRVIRGDVGLTARVLRMANSAALGRRAVASDVDAAVMALGMRRTCDILVGVCARQMYATPDPRSEALWAHAVTVAVAAQELAAVTRRCDVGLAFLTGLFHDVGRFALFLADPQAVEIIAAVVETGLEPQVVVERQWYGFDHAECGAVLVQEWGLAPEQVDAVRAHHHTAVEDDGLGAVLRAANVLAHRVGTGGGGCADGHETAGPVLGLSPSDESACIERIQAAVSAYRELLS